MNAIRKTDQRLNTLISRIGHREEGFSMISAIMALMVGTLLSLSAWATANSDINFTDKDKWSRVAYQRAQSGISDYVQHMAEDSGYWKSCDRPDGITGDGLGQTAVNDNDFGVTGHSTRRWLPYATAGSTTDLGYNTQYTIDLQPTSGSCKPSATSADRMIDNASGTFRVAVTGRAGPLVPSNLTGAAIEAWRQQNWKRVTLVAEFRRNGFLDYGYFTDKEGQDPGLQTSLTIPETCDAYYQDNPGYSSALPNTDENKAGRWRASSPNDCQEIQFANGDKLQGPFHTNDSVLLASVGTGGALFGNANKGDRVEVYDNGKATNSSSSCPFRSGDANLGGTSPPSVCTPTNVHTNTGVTLVTGPGARYLDLPDENDDLTTYADPYSGDPDSQGYTFLGKTNIVLLANNTFKVTNSLVNGGVQTTYPFPTSGVIYVANNGVSSCQADVTAKYPGLTTGCAIAEVSGTYNKSLTIGSQADVVFTGNTQRGTSQTAVLGVVANQYVRVRHYQSNSTDSNYGSGSNCLKDTVGQGTAAVTIIQAAILALQHSFTVDSYTCGNSLGTLNFTGALAQRFRGAVGQGTHGYTKNYAYDYTFKSQTPPHFLAPSAATWRIIRLRQTLPACKCAWNG
jgi:Tfp pilus assembly protein PilX